MNGNIEIVRILHGDNERDNLYHSIIPTPSSYTQSSSHSLPVPITTSTSVGDYPTLTSLIDLSGMQPVQ